MMKRTFTAVVLVILALTADLKAQTVATVIAGAEAVKNALNDAITNAGVEGRSVVDSANGTIDGAIAQLRLLVNDTNKPVNQLTGTAQGVTTQLQNTVSDLNKLLQVRTQCGLEGIERLVYGVKTITSQLQNAIPLIKGSKPYLYGFTFDGHNAGIIPVGGGRLSIRGFNLWPSDLEPIVTLVDANSRQPIKPLQASGANDSNAVSVVLDAGMIATLAGKCAEFKVTPRQKKGIWPFRSEENLNPMYLPVCVPQSLTTAVRVIADAKFQCSAPPKEVPLAPQEFRCDNSSCEHRGSCHVQKTWDIPAGCTIARTEKAPGGFMKDASVDTVPITNVGGNYTASGTINEASCTKFGGGLLPSMTKLNHSTIWQVSAKPVLRCTSASWINAPEVIAEPQVVSQNITPVCLDIQPPCADPSSSVYTAKLQLMDAMHVHSAESDSLPKTVLTTETVTAAGTAVQPFKNMEFQQIRFSGTANPNAGGHAQVCMTVTMPACGY